MSEKIVAQVNEDIYENWYIPKQGDLKFMFGKLYQYQWSQVDSQWAWYIIPGEEDE